MKVFALEAKKKFKLFFFIILFERKIAQNLSFFPVKVTFESRISEALWNREMTLNFLLVMGRPFRNFVLWTGQVFFGLGNESESSK